MVCVGRFAAGCVQQGRGPDITKVNALELVASTVISWKNNMPPFAAALTFAQIREVAADVATQLGK